MSTNSAKYRVKGEGSIVELPNGTYKGRIDLGLVNGKRTVKSVNGKTPSEVSKRMKELRKEIELGKDPFSKKQTLAKFLERWMEKKASTCRESTLRSYRLQIDRHICPALGDTELGKVSAAMIDRMLAQKQAEGLSGNSRRIIRCVLHGSLHQAFKWNLIAQNPVLRTDAPKIVRKETEFLSELQTTTFLRQAMTAKNGILYVTALFTGLRKGEILGLQWSDVDFEERCLRVSKQLQRVAGKLSLVKPKTEKSCRTVPIPDALVCILKDHKSKQLLDSSMLSEWKQTGFVFTSSIGTPMDPRNASKELKPILKAAKLPDIRFHDLRHSNATLMLAHGADLKTVMDHLGHNQIALTANLYGHRIPRLEREAADRMGSLFGT